MGAAQSTVGQVEKGNSIESHKEIKLNNFMTAFVIETRRGFWAIAEKLGQWQFPAGPGSLQGATRFPFKSAAQSVIRRHGLDKAPFHAHVEEIEIE